MAASARSWMRAPSAPPVAPMPRSRSTCSAAISGGSVWFGDWDHPYITMDPQYEAQQIRVLGKEIANGHVYAGAKPV